MTDRKPWAGSTGRQRTRTAQWRKVRAEVLDRDARTCLCGAPANDVDHVIPHAEGGTDDDGNLRAVCPRCHQAKTQAEAARGRARVAAMAKRQAEPHPGIRRA